MEFAKKTKTKTKKTPISLPMYFGTAVPINVVAFGDWQSSIKKMFLEYSVISKVPLQPCGSIINSWQMLHQARGGKILTLSYLSL